MGLREGQRSGQLLDGERKGLLRRHGILARDDLDHRLFLGCPDLGHDLGLRVPDDRRTRDCQSGKRRIRPRPSARSFSHSDAVAHGSLRSAR